MSPGSVDFPDIAVLGWTPTHEEWVAIVAVLAGAAGVVVLMAVFRRARRFVFAIAVACAIALIWTWLRR